MAMTACFSKPCTHARVAPRPRVTDDSQADSNEEDVSFHWECLLLEFSEIR